MKKKASNDVAEKQQKEKKSIGHKILKVLTVLVKILRWPVVYFGVLLGGVYAFYWIFSLTQGNQMAIYEVVGKYGTLLGGILAILVLLVSLLTSSLFTETFLASTGIAAGMYLFASLFITAPNSWGTDYVDFDTMKMFVFLTLVAAVLVGDIIVLVFRKVLRKRSLQHMAKHT